MHKHGMRRAMQAIALLVVVARYGGAIGGIQAGRAIGISDSYADAIRADLRDARIICVRRGHVSLSRQAGDIALADVVRAVCKPTAQKKMRRPQHLIAMAANYLQNITYMGLEDKTLADVIREADLLEIGCEA